MTDTNTDVDENESVVDLSGIDDSEGPSTKGPSTNEDISDTLFDTPEEPEPELRSGPEEPEEPGEDPGFVVSVKPKQRRRRTRRVSTSDTDLQEINEMIEGLGMGDATQNFTTLNRIEPIAWKGRRDFAGYLGRFDHDITIEEIKQTFGGGTYDIKIHGPKRNRDGTFSGNRVKFARRFKIAGDPIPVTHVTSDDTQREIKPEEPSTVKQAMSTLQLMQSKAQDKADKLTERLLDNSAKKDDTSMISMLQIMSDNSRTQLETIREENKAQIEAIREENKMLREQMREDRKEAARREEKAKENAEAQTTPLLTFMMEQNKQTKEAAIQQSKEGMSRTELLLTNIMNMSKVQMDSNDKATKTQIDLLTNQMKLQSEELRDARISGKSDALSEMKKLLTFKETMEALSGKAPEKEKDIMDRVMDNLPAISDALPGVISAIGDLFSAGTPVRKPSQRRVPHGAQRKQLPQPIEPPTEQPIPEEQPAPAEQPAGLDVTINQLIAKAEIAIELGTNPEEFVNNEVIGKFDDGVLRKISAIDHTQLIKALEAQIPVDDESQIFSVNGKNFLKRVHDILKSKM